MDGRDLLEIVEEACGPVTGPGDLDRVAEWAVVKVVEALMEREVEELVGPRGARRGRGGPAPKRHTAKTVRIVWGGKRVEVRVPRIKLPDGSVRTPDIYQRLTGSAARDEAVARQRRAGVSTRGVATVLAPVAEHAVAPRGLSRSAQSVREVARGRALLEELRERSLAEVDVAAVALDGTEVGRRTIVVALAITTSGEKLLLDIAEDQHETTATVATMLRAIAARGLDLTRVLWLIDGGKALRKAIEQVAGNEAPVQRCVVHKWRNVRERLPRELWPDVNERLYAAWSHPAYDEAARRLEDLAGELERDHPKAAGSVREGMGETLTCIRLGVRDELLRRLRSTNVIESVMFSIRDRTDAIRRWRDDDMRQRWVVTALADATDAWEAMPHVDELTALAAAVAREHAVAGAGAVACVGDGAEATVAIEQEERAQD